MIIDISQQTQQTRDGKTVGKGDKVWFIHQGPCIERDDLATSEVTVGEPVPWAPKLPAVQAKYCHSSEQDANDCMHGRGRYKMFEEHKEILQKIFGD